MGQPPRWKRTPKILTDLRRMAKNHPNPSASNEASCHNDGTQGDASNNTTHHDIHNTQNTTYGDYILHKRGNVIRIGFQNFNGLTGREDDPVDRSLRNWITDQDFDIFGVSEINLYWPRVKKHLQFHDRISKWWAPGQTRAIHSYNTTEKRLKRSVRQYGGTAQFSRGEAIARECEQGNDFRNLGRWVWQKYRGKNNKILRVVTAYRPNPSCGPYTVYAQHRAHFNQINKTKWEPRAQFLADLQSEIQKWRDQKEQAVLMMDCNEDIRSDTIQKFLDEVGMKEIILDRHGSDAPGTYIDGTLPIDGLDECCTCRIYLLRGRSPGATNGS